MSEEKQEQFKKSAIDAGIKPEYIVEINKQYFVVYKGLLDLAHTSGFNKRPFIGFVNNTVVQLDIPNKECVHMVTARFGNANECVDFTATGHASPDNISSKEYLPFYITISETRAKARALRDALNIPITSVEELGSETFENNSSKNGHNGSSKNPITQKQIDLINNILENNNKTTKILTNVFEKYGVSNLTELTIPQADTIIKKLKQQFESN